MSKEKPPVEDSIGAVAVESFLGGGNPKAAVVAHKQAAAKATQQSAVEFTPTVMPPEEITPSVPMPAAPAEKTAEQEEQERIEGIEEVKVIKDGLEQLDDQSKEEERAQKEFETSLKEQDLTKEQAWNIIDRLVLQNKPWVETVKIMNRFSVEFQTRDSRVMQRLNEEIEKQQLYHSMAVSYETWRLNLAASIVRYGGHRFDPDDMEAKLKWASDLQGPVYSMLTQRLREFDNMIAVVLQKGFMANF